MNWGPIRVIRGGIFHKTNNMMSTHLHSDADKIFPNENTRDPPEIIVDKKRDSNCSSSYIDRDETGDEIDQHLMRPRL